MFVVVNKRASMLDKQNSGFKSEQACNSQSQENFTYILTSHFQKSGENLLNFELQETKLPSKARPDSLVFTKHNLIIVLERDHLVRDLFHN